MSRLAEQSIMITAGMFEERTVRNVKTHIPNRFEADDCTDETGTISLLGKRVEVQTAYWGGMLTWELVRSGPTWPHCAACNAPLGIGMEMIWRCGMCEVTARKNVKSNRHTKGN